MFCRKCGIELSDDSVFCHNCGTKIIIQSNNNISRHREVNEAPTVCPICNNSLRKNGNIYECSNSQCWYRYDATGQRQYSNESNRTKNVEGERINNKSVLKWIIGIPIVLVICYFFRGIILYNLISWLGILTCIKYVKEYWGIGDKFKAFMVVILGIIILVGCHVLKEYHKQEVRNYIRHSGKYSIHYEVNKRLLTTIPIKIRQI